MDGWPVRLHQILPSIFHQASLQNSVQINYADSLTLPSLRTEEDPRFGTLPQLSVWRLPPAGMDPETIPIIFGGCRDISVVWRQCIIMYGEVLVNISSDRL